MGITASSAKLLLDARRRGCDFTRTLTLGRQSLFLWKSELHDLQRAYRLDRDLRQDPAYQFAGPADRFFHEFLDVESLQAMDCSSYEGASVVHDLNTPVPHELHEAFDVVIDGGTLEHVFNYSMGIENCMRMVKPRGSLFLFAPANNQGGHGFYQFSSELFFRLFDGVNGFRLKRILAESCPFPGVELSRRRSYFEISDPSLVGTRVGLVTNSVASLMVEAFKEETVPFFVSFPEQSDYQAAWSTLNTTNVDVDEDDTPRSAFEAAAYPLYRRLPVPIRRLVLGCYLRFYLLTFRNSRAYKKVGLHWVGISHE